MATNQFKPFATGTGANVLSLATWIADTDGVRTTGNVPNTETSSALNNRAIRQSTLLAAAFGELCAANDIDMLDTGNVSDVVSALSQLFVEMGGGGEIELPTDHNLLTNRDASDAHPISAITGLQAALDAKLATSSVVTSITASSTDAQVPSAKAVYSYGQTLSDTTEWGDITGNPTDNTALNSLISSYNTTLNSKVTGCAEITDVKICADESTAETQSQLYTTTLCFYPLV